MKPLIILIAIYAFALLATNAQQMRNDISFDKSERVENLNASGKYIGVRLYNKNTREETGLLYDTLGNKIFEYKVDTGHLADFVPNERNNQVIVINNRYWGPHRSRVKDKIVSYDIDKKNIKWSVQTIGGGYKISPDGKHLLTIVTAYDDDPDLSVVAKLDIIDLENGTLLPMKTNYHQFMADWYDNERIIIYTWEYSLNKNKQFINQYEKYAQGLDSIHKVKARLYFSYKKGKIGTNEYDSTMQQLVKGQKEYMVMQRKQLSSYGMPYSSHVRKHRLIRYNIITQEIEQEKNIMESENITTLIKNFTIGKYSGESGITIYLHETRDKTHKLDSNFNFIWSIEMRGRLYKVIDKHNMYFITYDKNKGTYNTITKNGGKQQLSVNNNVVIENENKRLSEYSHVIDLRNNFSFDRGNNSIKLEKEK